MSDELLPALPKPWELMGYSGNVPFPYYAAAHLEAYAREAIRRAALAGAAPVAFIADHPDGGVALRWPRTGPTLYVMVESDAPLKWPESPLFPHAPAKAREEWQPMETAPKGAPWWLVWSSLYQMPVVVTQRMDDGTYWDGDWDRDVKADHWLPLSPPAALATFAEGSTDNLQR